MEKMNSWLAMIGSFENSRAEAPLTFVSFIRFINYYISNACVVAQWKAWLLVRYVTWVRAPGLQYPNIIFQ